MKALLIRIQRIADRSAKHENDWNLQLFAEQICEPVDPNAELVDLDQWQIVTRSDDPILKTAAHDDDVRLLRSQIKCPGRKPP
jgi:hypothetical protein